MSPQREVYEVIEIRYGYAIQDDEYHAHFHLPVERRVEMRLQGAVHTYLSPGRPQPGKVHIHSPIEHEGLASARSAIDKFLGIERSSIL